eukprot:scaffold55760_cov28-Cyclotella_meneghiniana.AAC.3
MNGQRELAFKFIVYNGHHKLTFESQMGTNLVYRILSSHQDCMSLGQYMLFTAAGLFQCLIISIMNGQSGLAFKFIVCDGHHKLTFESQVGTNLVYGTLLFTP